MVVYPLIPMREVGFFEFVQPNKITIVPTRTFMNVTPFEAPVLNILQQNV